MISERSRPLTWQMPAKAGERLECAGKGSTSRTSRLRPTNKMNSTPHICQLTEESRSEISSAPRSFRQVRDISSQGRQPVRLMYVGQSGLWEYRNRIVPFGTHLRVRYVPTRERWKPANKQVSSRSFLDARLLEYPLFAARATFGSVSSRSGHQTEDWTGWLRRE